MTPLQLRYLDYVREMIAVAGVSPNDRELGLRFNVSRGAARDVVDSLVRDGYLTREPQKWRSLRLVDGPDLRGIPTDALSAELARRGVTRAALHGAAPEGRYGRTCAADSCGERVRVGHLMCREHWFATPAKLRERILTAFGEGDTQAYGDAVAEARDLIDTGRGWGDQRKRA